MDAAEHVEDALVSWVYPQRKLLTNLVESGNFNAEEMKKTLGRLAEDSQRLLRAYVSLSAMPRISRARS